MIPVIITKKENVPEKSKVYYGAYATCIKKDDLYYQWFWVYMKGKEFVYEKTISVLNEDSLKKGHSISNNLGHTIISFDKFYGVTNYVDFVKEEKAREYFENRIEYEKEKEKMNHIKSIDITNWSDEQKNKLDEFVNEINEKNNVWKKESNFEKAWTLSMYKNIPSDIKLIVKDWIEWQKNKDINIIKFANSNFAEYLRLMNE